MTWIKIAKAKAILTKTDILGGPNDPAAIKVGKLGLNKTSLALF